MTEIVKGSSVKISSTVYTDNLQSLADITGATITALFKKRYDDADADAILTKTVGSGITIVDATNGRCDTVLTAAELNNISYDVIYFEILVKQTSGNYIRNGVEQIKIKPNVIKTLN